MVLKISIMSDVGERQIPLAVVACGGMLWGGWDGPGGLAVETRGVAPSGDPIKRQGTALAAL